MVRLVLNPERPRPPVKPGRLVRCAAGVMGAAPWMALGMGVVLILIGVAMAPLAILNLLLGEIGTHPRSEGENLAVSALMVSPVVVGVVLTSLSSDVRVRKPTSRLRSALPAVMLLAAGWMAALVFVVFRR